MPLHERSQSGCWTCRIRKKKCDESLPVCSACTVRGITCYGYGQKPDWMDGGVKEKKVLDDLKQIIKENLRKKRSYSTSVPVEVAYPTGEATWNSNSQTPPGTSNSSEDSWSLVPAVPVPTLVGSEPTVSVYTATSGSSPDTAAFPPLSDPDHNPYYQHLHSSNPVLPTGPPGPEPDLGHIPRDCRGANPIPILAGPKGLAAGARKEYEANLLMNYLDHVFAFQYSCYTPLLPELGRGWLLALLTRTKALFHIALALSSWFMHHALSRTGRLSCSNAHSNETKRQYSLAFQELQLEIGKLYESEPRSLRGTIEALSCMSQMISFELLRLETNGWQIHLQAASSLLPIIIAHLNASSQDFISFRDNTSISVHDHIWGVTRITDSPPPDVDYIACDFLVCFFVWYDILASASRRTPSLLFPSGISAIPSVIDLSKIMGCENWAMLLIARISYLDVWRREHEAVGSLSLRELSVRGLEIEKELKDGLDRASSSSSSSNGHSNGSSSTAAMHSPAPIYQRHGGSTAHHQQQRDRGNFITRIFASAALTYLHTTLSGPNPSLPEIQSSVLASITLFDEHLLTSFSDNSDNANIAQLRNLVWPFIVTASMVVSPAQEAWARDIMDRFAAAQGAGSPATLWRGWGCVRECWARRAAGGKMVDWAGVMEGMEVQVLLV